MSTARDEVEIGQLEGTIADGRSRVTTLVDGEEVWFESSDLELQPSIEAIGSALLLPAAAQGRPLSLPAPVCSVWKENTRLLMRTAGRWWGYPELAPLAPGVRRSSIPQRSGRWVARRTVRRQPSALCFTCGVDSFHSALFGRYRPDALVLTLGFDVPLADEVRAADLDRRVRAVGAALGLQVVVIRTNLRECTVFNGASWQQTHGGALAAVGHLLVDATGAVVVSSSYYVGHDKPWGSHWRIDHRWSSSMLRVRHVGHRSTRWQKIKQLADEPLPQRHLQVCYAKTTPTGNCSVCRKCVSTMLLLAKTGRLDDFEVFEGADELPERLDAVDDAVNLASFEQALAEGVPCAADGAVRRLIDRANDVPFGRTWRRHAADLLGRP